MVLDDEIDGEYIRASRRVVLAVMPSCADVSLRSLISLADGQHGGLGLVHALESVHDAL